MANFAFVTKKLDGSEAYEEDEFALQAQAMAHGKFKVASAEKVSIGRVGMTGVDWIGVWSNDPQPASWQARDSGAQPRAWI